MTQPSHDLSLTHLSKCPIVLILEGFPPQTEAVALSLVLSGGQHLHSCLHGERQRLSLGEALWRSVLTEEAGCCAHCSIVRDPSPPYSISCLVSLLPSGSSPSPLYGLQQPLNLYPFVHKHQHLDPSRLTSQDPGSTHSPISAPVLTFSQPGTAVPLPTCTHNPAPLSAAGCPLTNPIGFAQLPQPTMTGEMPLHIPSVPATIALNSYFISYGYSSSQHLYSCPHRHLHSLVGSW